MISFAPLVFLALAGSGPAAVPAIDRHFQYPASSFVTHWSRDTLSVTMDRALAETTPGWPDLPLIAERIEVPAGMRIKAATVRQLQSQPLAEAARVRRVPPLRFDRDLLGHPQAAGAAPLVSSATPPVVELGYQGTMRGQRLAWVMVRPVRWDPASGRLDRITDLDLDLELEPDLGSDVAVRERIVPEWEDGATPAAATSLPKPAAQPFKPTQLPSVLGSPVAYVIVTTDALMPQFQRLADWKTQSGVPAVVRSLTTIHQEYPGTDDADRIRRFLRDAYTRWGTKWALLGGDTQQIPIRTAWTTFYVQPGATLNDIPTDLYYACLDGNWNADGDSLYGEGDLLNKTIDGADLLPELWVGRAAVGTVAEAQQFVDKTFQYSRTPVGDYEKNLLLFAEVIDPQNWNPGDLIFVDGAQMIEDCLPSVKANASMRYARLYENYLEPSYEPGALQLKRRAVIDSLDRGYNMAVHCGHGFRNVMSCGDSTINNSDAQALTNGNRLTNFYAVDCTSNAIDFPCLGEALMKAANGGAVTSIGSTRLDFPTTGTLYQQQFFKLVFHDSITAIGEAEGRQKLPYVTNAKTDNTHRWTQMAMILLGDPEMHLWTGKPRTLAVTAPASMAATDTTIAVHVAISGVALYGARVTAYKSGDDYTSALTDGAGNVTLGFRPDAAGSLTLTVTGYDCIPYQATIPITGAAGPLLVEGTITVDDDNVGGTSGNGDGVLDAGEVVDLTVPIKNNGITTSTSVTGVLSTSNPAVTMMVPGVSYGTIAPGATVTSAVKYRFTTSYTAADQVELAFNLSIVDAADHHFLEPLRLTLHSPELRSYGHTVVENVGNGNGHPEPGESVTYTASLRNSGSGVARGVTAILRRLDAKSTVTDSTSSYGNIAPGAVVAGDPFAFSLTDTAAFELRISTSQGLLSTQRIDLRWPATPVGLSALGLQTSAELSWGAAAFPDTDLAGYNIYRASALGGPYTKLNSVPTDRVAYDRDEGLTQLTRYYYEVSAVDSSGNESAPCAPVSVNTTPPTHTIFPIAMDANSTSSIAVARLYPTSPTDIIAGADQHLYVWNADGSAPVDADGSAVTSGDFSSAGAKFSAGASVADLDGGSLEIIAPTWNDQSVYVYDLQGKVKPGWPFVASAPIWSNVAIGDLDKDGTKELVFGSNSTNFYVLRSNGAEWMDGDGNPATQGVFKVLGSIYNYGTPALADIDGDGFLDIVYSGWDGYLYAWHSNGTNLPGFPIYLEGNSNSSVAIGYLDGPSDTQPEIVAASGGSDDSLYVFEPNGLRRAGFPVKLKTSGGTGKQPSPALADIDGDGFLDIVAASTDGKLYVYDRNGTLLPAFANVRYSSVTNGATTESSPVVADINGDGYPDIVIGDEGGTLSAFDHNGQLLPGFPIAVGAEVKGTPALCDCDGDGKSEIALASWDGRVYLWDYDFTFSPGHTPPWPQFHHDAMRTGFASASTTLAVPPGNEAPPRLSLSAPVPNPARRGAAFTYGIPAAAEGRSFAVDVFDLAGRHVKRLAQGTGHAGRYDLAWDLRDGDGGLVRSGLYLLVIEAAGQRQTRRVVALP